MPLTKSGKIMRKRFEIEYGPKKGDAVFYSFLNKHPNIARKIERRK